MGPMSDEVSPPRRRFAEVERAEAFLARVLPGADDDEETPELQGVDEATQRHLDQMGAPDRESW